MRYFGTNALLEVRTEAMTGRLLLREEGSELGEVNEVPQYPPNCNFFSLRIHYEGEMKWFPKFHYVNGKVAMIDYCHPLNIPRWRFWELADYLGFGGASYFYYKDPDVQEQNGFVDAIEDRHLRAIARLGLQRRVVDIYFICPTVNHLPVEPFVDTVVGETGEKDGEIDGLVMDNVEGNSGKQRASGEENESEKNETRERDTQANKGKQGASGKAELVLENVQHEMWSTEEAFLQSATLVFEKLEAEKPKEWFEGDGESSGVKNIDIGHNSNVQENEKMGEPNVQDDNDEDEIPSEFIDRDYDVNDDPDLKDLLDKRAKEWGNVENKMAEYRLIPTNNEDELEWVEPGDELHDEGMGSQSSPDSDDENENRRGVRQMIRFRLPEDKHVDVNFQIHMVFNSKKEFKLAVKHHGTVVQRKVRIRRSNLKRNTACCDSSPGCRWMVSINYRQKTDSWELTKMNLEHTCIPTFNHGCTTSEYLSQTYKEEIQIMPEVKVCQLQAKVRKDLNVNISRDKALRVKKIALSEIEADLREQYKQLRGYCNELLATNPGSSVFVQTEDMGANDFELFHRMYICFDACKRGFKEGCRPILGVDGCHLKGPHQGILLTAIGIDANDQIFPVAWAVVEGECKASWTWFLHALQEDLNIQNSSGWTIISDKDKGLDSAMRATFPLAEHRRCTWHMYKNFRGARHSSLELKELVWAAAKCTHTKRFDHILNDIRNISPAAYEWLMVHTDPHDWSRAWFNKEVKCDILVNNIVECFNFVIKEARTKPILTMLEAIRMYVMDRLQKKRNFISKMQGELGPKVQRKLNANMEESSKFQVLHSGDGWYQIKTLLHPGKYPVDLLARTCGCNKWQLTGIPCPHAITAISVTKEEPIKCVHHYYLKESYKKSYNYVIFPINGPDLWDYGSGPDVLGPKNLRLRGRPPLHGRFKDKLEKSKGKQPKVKGGIQKAPRAPRGKGKYTCSECKQNGHNKSTCPKKAVAAPGSSKNAGKAGLKGKRKIGETEVASTSEDKKQSKGNGKKRKHSACHLCGSTSHNITTCSAAISDMKNRPPVDYSEMRGNTYPTSE